MVRHRIWRVLLGLPIIIIVTSLVAQPAILQAKPQSEKGQRLLGSYYRYQQVEVSDYFTEARLRFDAETNPRGIFTSADGDTSNTSDAAARQELIALNDSGIDSFIRYVEAGDPNGDPIVLFHGLPTYSYLYRNVMPWLERSGRVIAFDQIGFGFSSKHKQLTYTYKQHLAYVEAFFEELGLTENITLVVHDSGGTLGFVYAARHPEQIKSLVFFETAYGPAPTIEAFPLVFGFWRSEEGNRQVIKDNIMVNAAINRSSEVIPPAQVPFTVRKLRKREVRAYNLPFRKETNRRVLAQFVREIPVGGGAPDGFGDTNLPLFEQYAQFLATSNIPKLFFYAEPGFANPAPIVEFVKDNFNTGDSLTSINLGTGYHYLQEDFPGTLGRHIAHWLAGLPEDR